LTQPSCLADTRIAFCGDCLEQLRQFPDNCIDLCRKTRFEAAIIWSERTKGFFVSFDYTSDAITEIQRFFKQTGRVIVPLTVSEILNDEIAMKLV
jgi:DNA modification methylase